MLIIGAGGHAKEILEEYAERGEMRNGYYGYWGGVVRPNFKWKNSSE